MNNNHIGSGGTSGTAAGVEHAYRGVRDAILSGQLRAGQLIPQIALAKLLNVSRTPLREALRLLQAEGLIEAQANQPMRVARLTLAGVEDLYALRIPLEVAALRLSVPLLDSGDFEHLELLVMRMRRLAAERNYAAWDEPHRHFHHALAARSGDRFTVTISQLIDQCARFRRMRVQHMWSDETELEHRALLDACIAHDTDRAAWLLAQHLGETAVALLRTVDPNYQATKLQVMLAGVPRPAGTPNRAYHHLTLVAA